MRLLTSLVAIGAGAYAYRNMDKKTKKQIRKKNPAIPKISSFSFSMYEFSRFTNNSVPKGKKRLLVHYLF